MLNFVNINCGILQEMLKNFNKSVKLFKLQTSNFKTTLNSKLYTLNSKLKRDGQRLTVNFKCFAFFCKKCFIFVVRKSKQNTY